MMKGLGNSIVGMHTRATSKKNTDKLCWKSLDPTTADTPPSSLPPFRNIPIIIVMTEGALFSMLVKLVSHLQMIMVSMYPNNTRSRMIYGTNSRAKSMVFF